MGVEGQQPALDQAKAHFKSLWEIRTGELGNWNPTGGDDKSQLCGHQRFHNSWVDKTPTNLTGAQAGKSVNRCKEV